MTPEDVTTNPRLAGLVRRFHTWPVLREQTNAEHSWQVMRIMIELFGHQKAVVWHYVQFHDLGEVAVGDVPYPVKARNPTIKIAFDTLEHKARLALGHDLPVLTVEQIKKVKLAHMLEMWEYGLEETVKGNSFAKPVMNRCADAAIDMTMNWDDGECNHPINACVGRYMQRMERLMGVRK